MATLESDELCGPEPGVLPKCKVGVDGKPRWTVLRPDGRAADRRWTLATRGSWGTRGPRTAWTGQRPFLNVFFLFRSRLPSALPMAAPRAALSHGKGTELQTDFSSLPIVRF